MWCQDCADAGWWMGEIGGRQGVFPDNFVKVLLPEVEKERPKKPPPPTAPSAKHPAGEETKVGDIPKPTLSSVVPKKPLPPKTSPASSSQAPRRPERPRTKCESPKSEGGASTPDSASDMLHDTEVDLDAVVSSSEKLNHPTAMRPRITDRRPRSQIIAPEERREKERREKERREKERREKERREKEEQEAPPTRPVDVSRRKGHPTISIPDGKTSLPPKPSIPTPISGSALRPVSPASAVRSPSPSAISPSPELRHFPQTPPSLDELRAQMRELKTSVELLKSQHRQEMRQLSSELEEEKRCRISLQGVETRVRPGTRTSAGLGLEGGTDMHAVLYLASHRDVGDLVPTTTEQVRWVGVAPM
ncbi:SH3 domain-containing kinase-binding protein 1 [Merluccius polli]|uniref:SH3 domain-containing kinase-binding protein 1 n=1 Tax=Merluccius polli TaxID=89951 RepID=A0AA47MY70_MERPO|nr:SH3 domain-containing kinase-binding protein 1 [Merluccius polli]